MSDSFYNITESSELNKKVRFQNILISPCRTATLWNFCVGIHRYSALTYDVMKSYLTRVWDKKIRNDYLYAGFIQDITYRWVSASLY